MLIDNAVSTQPPGNMPGFDPEFADIVDYILRITRRIWEGKQVGLCGRYYAPDCPVYTLAGYSEGAEAVMQNTLKTLGAFPDRRLEAENIIWSGTADTGFHTSHLIDTYMSHLGDSEHGAATGRSARFKVIAHCVVHKNQIVEEWLVRDNWLLAEQLGCDPLRLARETAQTTQDPDSRFARWLSGEWTRVQALPRTPETEATTTHSDRITLILRNVWNARLIGDCRALYAEDARIHASAQPVLEGIDAIERFFISLLGALPDARFSADHACTNSMKPGEYLSLRWTIAGTHDGNNLWGPASGARIVIMGESQFRLETGRVVEEWFVYDKLAVLTQIERERLKNTPKREGGSA